MLSRRPFEPAGLVSLNISIIQAANILLVDQRKKAIQAALSLTAGAYQTSLVSYFTHKDLFPALMKVGYSLDKLYQ
jgi:hypothetical protein